jgi:PAS domain S-box-containing protein
VVALHALPAVKLPASRILEGGVSPLAARVAMLWRGSFDALLLVDDGRRYQLVNEPAAELLGAPRQDIVRARVDDFTPPELLPRLERLWRRLAYHGTLRGPFEVKRSDGTRSSVEVHATHNFTPGGHLLVVRVA